MKLTIMAKQKNWLSSSKITFFWRGREKKKGKKRKAFQNWSNQIRHTSNTEHRFATKQGRRPSVSIYFFSSSTTEALADSHVKAETETVLRKFELKP